jgi:hypothetical protein
MALNEQIALQEQTIKHDIEIKTEKINKLETIIMDYAKENRLWKCLWWNRYITFDALLLGIMKAKRCQRDDLWPLETTILVFKYGPKSRNDEIRPEVEKYNVLKEDIEDLKKRSNLLGKEQIDTSACNYVMDLFPKFRKDFSLLVKVKYVEHSDERTKWTKSKQSLAEYFGYQYLQDKNIPWKSIETLFDVKGLKNSFKTQYNKYSKDYEELLKILETEKDTPEG